MSAPSTAGGVDWEGYDGEVFRATAEALKDADPTGRLPYWRCQSCLGPTPQGQWEHFRCTPVIALGRIIARLLSLAREAEMKGGHLPEELKLVGNAYRGMAERIREKVTAP